MNETPNEGKLKVYASYGLLMVIFFVDCFLSFSIFGGIPYVIGLVLVMWLLPSKEMMRFGIACGLVALLGYFSPSSELSDNMGGLMTRFMAIFTVITIALLTRRESDLALQFKEQEKLLNSVIEKRTSGLKQVVEQFDEAKIRLAEAEQLGHFGFWEFHPGSRNMVWSNGVFNIYGYPITPQAPSIQDFLNQTHIDDVNNLQDSIESTLTEKKAATTEYRITMPDGSFKWLSHRSRPVLNPHGDIDIVVGTIQDITFLKQSEHQIDVNTAKYTTLFKSAAVPKALFIPDKRILEVNDSFCRWIGYHEKELLKVPIEKLMHKDDRSMDDAYAREIVHGDLDVYRKEKRFVRKNGQTVWGLFNVAAVLDANNKVLYFSTEIIDITRLKATEMARTKAEEAWKEAEETLTEMEAERRIAQQEGREISTVGGGDSQNYEVELEQAYAMAEEVIDNLFILSNDKLAIMGEDGLYKRVSPQLTSFLGYKTGDLDEQRVVEYVHPEGKKRFHQYQDNLFSSEAPQVIKIRHLTAEGSHEWVEMQARFNRSHEVAYVVFEVTEPYEMHDEHLAMSHIEQEPVSVASETFEAPALEQHESLNGVHTPASNPTQEFISKEPDLVDNRRNEIQAPQYPPENEYPTLEQQLQQLYGEVDPSKVNFYDEPPSPPEQVSEDTGTFISEPAEPSEELPEEPDYLEEPAYTEDYPEEQDLLEPESDNHFEPALPENQSDFIEAEYDNPRDTNDDFIGIAQEEDHYQPEPSAFIAPSPDENDVDSFEPEPPPSPIDQPSELPHFQTYDDPSSASYANNLPEPMDHLYEDDLAESNPYSEPEPVQKKSKPRPSSDIPWRQLTDKMPFVVWMLDTTRQCKYVNKKHRDFTGLPFEQLEGTGWSKTIHPDDYRKYVKYSDALVSQKNPVGFAYRVRRADGLYRWMQETSIPLFDRNDQFEGYLATSLDISKLKRVGAQFSKALEATVNLEDIHSSLLPCLQDESTFAVTESIKVADALINNAREMPQHQLSTLMGLAGQRMLSLVNGMLGFSNIRLKQTNLMQRNINIGESISSIVDMLTPLRRTGGPRFQINEKGDPFMVVADKVLLHRILENLIRGLQEYAESRVITIDLHSDGKNGVVEIGHVGPILTSTFLHQLSDLYRESVSLSLYQRKAGLHLSLARKLIELMQGSLNVLEVEGVGPVISIQLNLAGGSQGGSNENTSPRSQPQSPRQLDHSSPNPVRAPRPAATRTPQDQPARTRQAKEFGGNTHQLAEVASAIDSISTSQKRRTDAPAKNGNGAASKQHSSRHRLLIGEQNRDTQRLIRSLLQADYDLSIVPSVEDFFKLADDSAFDLFLLDIHMQSGDGRRGVDILRELRSRPQYRRTPVIAVASGNSGASKSELIDRGGFDDFLRKPFSIVELLETVEKMISS